MITDYTNRFAGVDLAPAPRNDPKLLALVAVRCKRPFWLKGKPVAVGAVVQLQRHDALSLQAIGKVEILA